MPPVPLPHRYLLQPQKIALRQLPPHPDFAVLPEVLQPIGQGVRTYDPSNVPAVDGSLEQPAQQSLAANGHASSSDAIAPVGAGASSGGGPSLGAPDPAKRDMTKNLEAFLERVLAQGHMLVAEMAAQPFPAASQVDGAFDPAQKQSPWKPLRVKTCGSSRVELFRRDVQRTGWEEDDCQTSSKSMVPKPETWFARRSHHLDETTEGNARWSEFVYGLKEKHAEREAEYTADLVDARRVLTWSIPEDMDVCGYTNIEMSLHENCHRLPPPLKRRVFPIVVISAMASSSSFIVLQLPVQEDEMRLLPQSLYCRRPRDYVFATYSSVEYVYTERDDKIAWIMAVGSDAGGALPMWVQNQAIPGTIAKDVPLFLQWIKRIRPERDPTHQPADQGKPDRFSTLRRQWARTVRVRRSMPVFGDAASRHCRGASA
ncbi:MAG: hypothetical protein M1838_003144 [Thelocarpon superellum]|nr:MAG: hypothetical protein M1838_003144 [Thelocarpon superellum]